MPKNRQIPADKQSDKKYTAMNNKNLFPQKSGHIHRHHPQDDEPVLIMSESGMPILETMSGVTMPADYSFECVNNFVHCENPGYEDLQNLALGMASHIGQLEAQITATVPQAAAPKREKHQLSEADEAAFYKAAENREQAVELPSGALMFINYGEGPQDYSDLDCPHCGGSGHKGDIAEATLDDGPDLSRTNIPAGSAHGSTLDQLYAAFHREPCGDTLAAIGWAIQELQAVQPDRRVDDLAALVRRLVRSLSKASPDHALPAKAVDYLQRIGLQGSPLRDVAINLDDVATDADILHALKEVRKRLQIINDTESAISDTLWYSDHETLFDYIDAAIAASAPKDAK